jgi:hypothetical protein
MARDYKALTRGPGVFVPRWVVALVVAVAAVYFTLRILVPPSFIVKRLVSPNGERSAQLMRTQHGQQHFTVLVKSGWLWRTLYVSAALTNDLRVDLGERLVWSRDSNQLFLELNGRAVWGHDFTLARALGKRELEEAGRKLEARP